MVRPTALVRFVVLACTGVYTGLLFLSGAELSTFASRLLASLPFISGATVLLWDAWLWKIFGLQQLTHRPSIRGLWRVTLTPTAESQIPPGGNRGPIDAYFVIRQTFWSLSVRSLTKESTSDSQAFFWNLRKNTDVSTLTYIFENTPKMSQSNRSPRSLGTCLLDPTSLSPTEMVGSYFTDRYTKGDITAELVDRSRSHASFDAADRHWARNVGEPTA
ncbi:hypothetical protein AB4Y63_12175 [Leifsonia sp. YAF41]|uniref:Cap15 family cyclic dinucleotide receptor domain-containing protein n=1 Tax=Leifsonia sp. YAF41 TaxID=3233086 RepID=UPI003F980272